MTGPMINVGINKDAIREARNGIYDILSSSNDQLTKQVALNTLSSLCFVKDTSISNCSFTNHEAQTIDADRIDLDDNEDETI